MKHRKISGSILTCLVTIFIGCGPDFIRTEPHFQAEEGFRVDDDAKIEDSVSHRELLNALLAYRKAVVNKDFGGLKNMIADSYYENGGTTDTTKDDYDQASLPGIFEMLAQHSDQIKMEITVKDVGQSGNRAHVDYEYRYAYEYNVGDKSEWDAGVELNRLEFVSEDGAWKIVSGL
jgi:hypothetical protein